MTLDLKISQLTQWTPTDTDIIPYVDLVSWTTKKALKSELKGAKWDAATLDVWTTTTWTPWSNATVTNVWTTSDAIFDFVIPRWDKGEDSIVPWPTWNWIASITLISTVWLVKTYRITYTDTTTFDFEVTNWVAWTNWTNWRWIVSILRTTWDGSPWTTDIYTITYTDATTSTFSVYNGTDWTWGWDLLASNNLSDLVDIPTARTNLEIIDDVIVNTTKTYSSNKIQALHNTQAEAIQNLSWASATFHNATPTLIPETPTAFLDLTWTNDIASSNTLIFELWTNEITFKKDWNYNFLNSMIFSRAWSWVPVNITFELYDADTSTVLLSSALPLDIRAWTSEVLPLNVLLPISWTTDIDPVRVKVRMQASSVAWTVTMESFNTILFAQSVVNIADIDTIPTDWSVNAVESNWVFDALATKVWLTWNETIGWVKTFSDNPIISNATPTITFDETDWTVDHRIDVSWDLMRFIRSASVMMVLNSSGNVWIGTSTPWYWANANRKYFSIKWWTDCWVMQLVHWTQTQSNWTLLWILEFINWAWNRSWYIASFARWTWLESDLSFNVSNVVKMTLDSTWWLWLWTIANTSAILDIDSTTRWFLPPRMTTAQRNAISSPATWLQAHTTDWTTPSFYDWTNWQDVWYKNIPQNSKSSAYTLTLTDAWKHIYHPSADTTARIWTIPANASVAYPIGTAITFINDTSWWAITISITTDTLVLAWAWTTWSRTLASNWVATAIKITSTRWIINWTNLT